VVLLERAALLDELRGAIAAAASGDGRLVVLEGESGVGKSSVLRAVVGRPPDGVRVLWGACDALATPRPLGPLRDMAAHGATATATRLLAGRPTYDVFDAFLEDLRTPTVAVMEDLHWADEATLDLLRFVGRRIGATRSLVLASLRDDEVDTDHPLRAVLGDLATSGLTRHRIEPLSIEGVRTLAAGHEVDPEALHRVTGGNPFYLTEVLAAPATEVPPTVRDAVLSRVARLAAPSRELLQLASIEPGGMSRARLRDLGVEDRAVDEAVRAGVVVDDGRVLRFRHELARLAVEEGLSRDRAGELHGRLLAALETDPTVDPARLAHHAWAIADRDAQLRWSYAAADAALRVSAYRQAVAHFAAAADHVDLLPPGEAAALLAGYAEALTAVDQPVRAVEAWERAVQRLEAAGDLVGLWMARAHLARALWTAGRSADGYALIDATTDALRDASEARDDGRVAEALAISAYLAMLARRCDDAVARAERAIDVAMATGRRTALPVAHNALGSARIVGFEDLSGLDDLRRSGAIAEELGERRSVEGSYSNAGSALGEIRRYAEAVESLEMALAYATAHDLDFARHYVLAWFARIRFEQGRWADADVLASQALGEGEVSPISPMVALVVRGRIRARRGLPEPRASLDEAWASARRTNDLQRTWPAITGLAEAAWLESWPADEVGGIAVDTARVLEDARRLRLPWAIGELAFWLDRLGHGPVDGAGAAPPFAASLAGEHRTAAGLWAALGCPYEAAWAIADVGDEPSLREALDSLIALGADPLANRIRRRLRAIGAKGIPAGPRRSTTRSRSGLTAREAEVLELLARGLTDREIAEELIVSVRTASHHVSAILAKLGVRRRTEAVAMAKSGGSADAKGG
jgi:DNA-binding CsgD family transcriptional regulator/tetratricopeptide (TPR) repeat protein